MTHRAEVLGVNVARQVPVETFRSDNPCVEYDDFRQMAEQIMLVQEKNRRFRARRGGRPPVAHAFHAKTTFAVQDATLTFLDRLPPEFEQPPFAVPGRTHGPVTVRFSNASGVPQADGVPDLRGAALRIPVDMDAQGADRSIDLLLTNYPVSHARDARQFVRFAQATAGGRLSKALGAGRLLVRVGPVATVRMYLNVLCSRCRIASVATESYFSRGALRWGTDADGNDRAVRCVLRPTADNRLPDIDTMQPDYLTGEAALRLEGGDITFQLCLHGFLDERRTPIENTAARWKTAGNEPVPVAMLTIRQRPRDCTPADPDWLQEVDFNPWNTLDDFRPLGNLNRARKAVYDASAAYRHDTRFPLPIPLRNVVFGAINRGIFAVINMGLQIPWHRLPTKLALLNLQALRQTMFRQNLIDPVPDAPPSCRTPPAPPTQGARIRRTPDGRFNDLSSPAMGAVGAPFGRNMPIGGDCPDLINKPDPIRISAELLARRAFIPAPSLNILAASWIQFQVHDWIHHERAPLGGWTDIVVRQPRPGGGPPISQIQIAGDDPGHRVLGRPGVHRNTTTFWWDASEIYGNSASRLRSLSDDRGQLGLGPGGVLRSGTEDRPTTGFGEAWWSGLAVMHTLFAREHNLLGTRLMAEYPTWPPGRVFETARLIIAALMAKIQTLEWTPAALATEPLRLGMNANWSGPRTG